MTLETLPNVNGNPKLLINSIPTSTICTLFSEGGSTMVFKFSDEPGDGCHPVQAASRWDAELLESLKQCHKPFIWGWFEVYTTSCWRFGRWFIFV